MKVLVTTIGSSGDVNPLIAVGLALQRRGHEVAMLVNPYFESQVRDAGLEYRPLGEKFDLSQIAEMPDVMHRRKGSSLLMTEFILPSIPVIIDALEETIERQQPDMVLYHSLCLGARWVCRRHGVPHAQVALSPLLWFSSEEPGLLRWWEPETQPRWYLRLRHRAVRLTLRWMDRTLNRIGRTLDLQKS